jgi:LPS O-antigen subunit length determinant protein (WzzB/FepE family)
MEHPEVPLEQSQEDILHHAHSASESWIMGVALTAALLAVLAAITALLAEHYANEAMILQIQSSDQWNFYQAKSIKSSLLNTRIDVLAALGKPAAEKDVKKLEEYKTEQEEIKAEAEQKQHESESFLRQHTVLSRSLTLFQVGIAIGAIAVLTKRKAFWTTSLAFGVAGVLLFAWSFVVH